MIFTLLFIILVIVILRSWLRMLVDSNRCNVPGPLPLPIIGNAHLFFGGPTRPLPVFSELAKKYNHAYRMYVLSHRYVIVSHPKYVEPLLMSAELINKGRIYDLLRPWLGNGLVTSSGTTWKTHRKLITPAFHFNILQKFLPVFIKNQKIFRKKLTPIADGRSHNLADLLVPLSFDNIAETAIGVTFNAQNNAKSEYFIANEELAPIFSDRFRNPISANDFLFSLLPQKTKMDEALAVVHKYSDETIKKRRTELQEMNITHLNNDSEFGTKTKFSFLDSLLLAQLNGEDIDDKTIASQVDTFMFAGHETIATTTGYVLYCISKHKDVQDKVLEEQKEIFQGDLERDPTYSDIQNMKYLDLVIKESLRLYPAAPMFERLMTEDTEIAGLLLPKDTLLTVNAFETGRNPEVFEDPLAFKPERFEGPLKYPCSWIPFSAGPRNCIGQRYAMIEMKVIVSSIVKHFEILPTGQELELMFELVLKSKNGVRVCFRPRL